MSEDMNATTSLVSGVDFVTVPTRDFDKANEFYGDVLGLQRSKRWGDRPAGEFETGNLTIAIMQSDAFGIEFEPHSLPIALHVDDVDSADQKCGCVHVFGHPISVISLRAIS